MKLDRRERTTQRHKGYYMTKPKYFKFSFPSGDPTGIARCAYDKSAKFVCGFPVAGPSFWKNENGIKLKDARNS